MIPLAFDPSQVLMRLDRPRDRLQMPVREGGRAVLFFVVPPATASNHNTTVLASSRQCNKILISPAPPRFIHTRIGLNETKQTLFRSNLSVYCGSLLSDALLLGSISYSCGKWTDCGEEKMEREMQVQRVNLSSVDPPSASVFEGAQQTRKEESRPSSLCPIKDSSLIHSPAKRCLERGGANGSTSC